MTVKLSIAHKPLTYCTTGSEVVKVAAAAGITLRQPNPYTTELVDSKGRSVRWWVGGDSLFLSLRED